MIQILEMHEGGEGGDRFIGSTCPAATGVFTPWMVGQMYCKQHV
jgi:hypothetical protein